MLYPVAPCAKPRMTRRDRWLKPMRPAVAQYMAFKDLVRLHRVALPTHGATVTFFFAMPASWSQKKKSRMAGAPHDRKPDLDNLLKALCDACYPDDDSTVWDVRVTKLWAGESGILIKTGDQT